jgi:predicted AAA+ superfamily ATPase
MEIEKQESKLIEVDEDRLNDLMQLCKKLYPDVADYFIHGICVEQLMFEKGYENKELADELYNKAQEELKKTEYDVKIEKLSE